MVKVSANSFMVNISIEVYQIHILYIAKFQNAFYANHISKEHEAKKLISTSLEIIIEN